MRRTVPVVVLGSIVLSGIGGCDRVFNLELVEVGGGSSSVDSAVHDGAESDGHSSVFGEPTPIVELTSANTEDDPTVTADGLEMYFNSYRDGGSGSGDIWHTTRPTVSSAWAPPTNVTSLNTSGLDNAPRISGDGLVMYMARDAATRDMLLTERDDRIGQGWSTPGPVTNLNTTNSDESEAMLSADGLTLYFSSDRSGDSEIYYATRTSPAGPWSDATILPGVSVPTYDDESPFVTPDGLTIYFSTDRPGSKGMTNIWRATRTAPSVAFGSPEPVDELNSDEREEDPCLSTDGYTIWFASGRAIGVLHIYSATR